MKVPQLVGGRFRERLTRFSCLVDMNGTATLCFLPNPGRLIELLIQGREVLLVPQKGKERKTPYDLFALRHEGKWVVVDSRVPNRLTYESLLTGVIPEFKGYDEVKPEPAYGTSRFDFLLENGEDKCLMEVKSCTLVEKGVAMFPDAPTTRGRRHMEELLMAKKQGYRACVLFIIQREDAEVFRPNEGTDPDFSRALRKAASRGVEVLAYASAFRGNEIRLKEKIPVKL